MFVKKNESDICIEDVITRNTGHAASVFLERVTEPYIHNLEAGCEVLKVNKDKPVHVIGDYDVDGIFGTTIMELGLKKAGFQVTSRLPLRFSEGYGLSEKIIDEINNGVVVTVDNGIAAFKAIEKAKKKGLTVIVTDHHLAPVDEDGKAILPPADVVIDPTIDERSEYHDYCGAAVAYRFVKQMLGKDNMQLKVLASIATVADVMDLTPVNHQLVKEGLKLINAGRCVPALKEILKQIELTDHITESDYGFQIGPIINASSRLYDDGAVKVLQVMETGDKDFRLPWKVKFVVDNNTKRKIIMKEDLKRVNEALALRGAERPIVVYDPKIGEGIIGLVAGRLCEEYHCPVITFTDCGKDFLKGSGRSIPEIHLKDVLDKIQDKIVGYGGHAGAAGLTIRREDLDSFTEAFKTACGDIPEVPKDTVYDLELLGTDIPDAMEALKRYAPYGNGNPRVRFLITGCKLSDYHVIGDGDSFMAKCEPYGLTVVGFGLREKYETIGSIPKLDCIGYLEESWFKGKMSYKMELIDFRASLSNII